MFNSTRFAQLLKPIRPTFQSLVTQHQSDKHSKGFSSWNQLVAMMYAQFSGVQSLRELVEGFNSQAHHHYHLGVRTLKRSTLSEANAKRSSQVYEALCQQLMTQVNRRLRKQIQTITHLIDSSPIQLLGKGYEWAERGRRVTGFKLHLQLSLQHQVPTHFEISHARKNDIGYARQIDIEPGARYVFDAGYVNYQWWHEIHQKGATFITRPKKNAVFKVVHQNTLKDQAPQILSDQVIRLATQSPVARTHKGINEMLLRRIEVKLDNRDHTIVLFSNDLQASAQEIAALYKQRWQIELFFKWIKQHLKIKRFMGQTANAVRIQILTALIVYLLVKIEQIKQGHTEPMRLVFWRLAHGLFERPSQVSDYYRRKRAREAYEKHQLSLL
jgi:IS4 transposase